MERVDDIGIVEVDGGSLVRDVDRMVERKIPDGERLVFGIAGVDAALVLVVELAQARGEFAGARAGRGDQTSGRVVSMYSFLPYPSSETMRSMSCGYPAIG